MWEKPYRLKGGPEGIDRAGGKKNGTVSYKEIMETLQLFDLSVEAIDDFLTNLHSWESK